LKAWDREGRIRWIRLEHPSQPAALNVAICKSTQPFLLFLDDDIRIDPGFVKAHYEAFESEEIWAVAGQVLQPGEAEDTGYRHQPQTGLLADVDFVFRSAAKCFIRNGMSGNLCVRRNRALEIGGFDENFSPPVAYRFDNEFCKRLVRAGGKILFAPEARIYHLRARRGGTRTSGSHMTSISPEHGVGDYYFALRCAAGREKFFYMLRRPFREIRTKFHLAHPWWIPVKFIGELRAIRLAFKLCRRGPRLISAEQV
jgi:GT2 family glycosyltransferase